MMDRAALTIKTLTDKKNRQIYYLIFFMAALWVLIQLNMCNLTFADVWLDLWRMWIWKQVVIFMNMYLEFINMQYCLLKFFDINPPSNNKNENIWNEITTSRNSLPIVVKLWGREMNLEIPQSDHLRLAPKVSNHHFPIKIYILLK